MAKLFSTEDGNLSTSIRITRERLYSDIDLSLEARTSTDGDVYKKTDAAAVKQAIKNLLMTNRFEKPYRPDYGANLRGLIFELATADTGQEIIENIKRAIQRYEPRVQIMNIKVTASVDYNSVSATIEFKVVGTNVVDVLRVGLTSTGSTLTSVPPPVAPAGIIDRRLLDEQSNRLISEAGKYIVYEIGTATPDGSIETTDGDYLLTQNSEILLQE